MNILHYTIGIPPTRNGGSVQYAYDLMREQAKNHNVYALTCGDTLFRLSKSKIKYSDSNEGIKVYKLTNPLTPTLIYGTSDPDSQHRDIVFDKENIREFVKKNQIEVMHLHTLMGLHKDIVEYIKCLGVKIIYTTHDFNGVCPHYDLLNQKGENCTNANGHDCAVCNAQEPSDRFLRIANSSLYHFLKKSGLTKLLKKSKSPIKSQQADENKTVIIPAKASINKYESLLNYYKDFFKLINRFHFNSSQTKEIFLNFIPDANGEVISVITSGIKDNRKSLVVHNVLRFAFVGSLNDYKGFPLLRKVLTELYNKGYTQFRLDAYCGGDGSVDSDCPNITYRPGYKYSELSHILHNLDCMIVPSKWYETFSLVTLEALGHGTPVIVSNHVGAKDIVREYDENFIFSTEPQLKDLLKSILQKPSLLKNFNNLIMQSDWKYSIEQHASEILNFYSE